MPESRSPPLRPHHIALLRFKAAPAAPRPAIPTLVGLFHRQGAPMAPASAAVLALVVALAVPASAHGRKRPLGVMTATCQDGREAFCDCHSEIERSNPIMCKNILHQCHASFCSPLCLTTAWEPSISVRCDRAPTWRGCKQFAAEVERAERAITAQFQAHVCAEDLKCCTNATRLLDWVENHVYGDLYPDSHLPLQSCAQGAASTTQNICKLCKRVVEVDIRTDPKRCLPPHKTAKDVLPLSLHERCLFLSDIIASKRDAMVQELRNSVCSCSGCCQGGCYYKEHESDEWIECVAAAPCAFPISWPSPSSSASSSILDGIESSFKP